jgi:hypothetical protein
MSRRPNPFLGATRRVGYIDKSVTEVELEFGVYSGIKLKSYGDGMVPAFEEHDARLARGIRLEEWSAMSRLEKAFLIAHWRIKNAMQNLQSEAEIRQARQDARKTGKR